MDTRAASFLANTLFYSGDDCIVEKGWGGAVMASCDVTNFLVLLSIRDFYVDDSLNWFTSIDSQAVDT